MCVGPCSFILLSVELLRRLCQFLDCLEQNEQLIHYYQMRNSPERPKQQYLDQDHGTEAH